MGNVLIVDDDPVFLKMLGAYVAENYPNLEVSTCENPQRALEIIRTEKLDFLVLDLEMPGVDGAKLLRFAVENGMDSKRIVLLSGRDADYLHAMFPLGTCLAVMNKFEVKQKAVLEMVFSSLDRKAAANRGTEKKVMKG